MPGNIGTVIGNNPNFSTTQTGATGTAAPTTPNTSTDPYSGNYTDLGGYNTAQNTLFQQLNALNSNSSVAQGAVNQRLSSVGDEFTSLFTNLVGRPPTSAEVNQFYSQSAGNIISNSASGTGRSETDSQNVNNQIQQFIGQNFQQAANQYATQQLQAQQGQATDLANQYRQLGQSSINDTQNSLLNYQQQLFQRLQPGLITSLQAQGLLNTGGMNEAIAGVQGDLANNASQYIAQLTQANNQAANQIQYSGAAAPYQYQQSLIAGQPGELQGAGANAANFNNNTYFQNLATNNALRLQNGQAIINSNSQPSFLRTLGQSTATAFGPALLPTFASSGGSALSSIGGSGGGAGGASEFAGMV